MEKSSLLVTDCIKFGWNTFRARPWFFVMTIAIYVVIQGVVALVENGAPNFITFLLSVVVSTLLYSGMIAVYLKAHDNVSFPQLKDLWNPKPFVNYLLLSILLAVIIVAGLILLVVPGVIFALMFSMAGFLVIEKNMNPLEALKESARLTKGYRVKILLLGFALLGLTILGIIPLMLGLLVVAPLSMLALVHVYRTLSGGTVVAVEHTTAHTA